MLTDGFDHKTASAAFIVENDKGLHTRPSTELVKCAILFNSEISLLCNEQKVSAKSLLGILTLAASKGTEVTVEAIGPDAEEAIAAILDLANRKFHITY